MRDITVVIPSSPIRSHPSTRILDETIQSIRFHLPTADIIIGIDGVRAEQEYLRAQYEQYIDAVLWKSLHQWVNVLPVVYETHQHQSGMMRDWFKYIKTPLLLYVEADTPLVTDRDIDWQLCVNRIMDGTTNTIRFHHENVVPDEHWQLMLDTPKDFLLPTIQWSQRPHLSSVAYYRDEVMRHFSESSRTFIEDLFHGVVIRDYDNDGKLGWYKHRLHIYYPDDPVGIQRSYNLDGRADEPKYDMVF